jgi:hypothetical protein
MVRLAMPGPGRFRCEMCGGVFAMGDEEEARAEAIANGLDPDDCGLVCDDCYALTPYAAAGQSCHQSLKRSWASSVYRTVCWILRCPK